MYEGKVFFIILSKLIPLNYLAIKILTTQYDLSIMYSETGGASLIDLFCIVLFMCMYFMCSGVTLPQCNV